jgi:hypothetical protein
MSPVIVVQKKVPPDNTGEKWGSRDWIWMGLAMVCTWLLLTGLHRLFTDKAVTPPPPSVPAITPTEALQEPPAPLPPPRTFLMHDEAVRATVKGLRERVKECPDAPDVLSEEQIKAIEKEGSLIQ